MFRYTQPSRLRIEASSACNLRCPACPTTTGHIPPAIGTGLLAPGDFRQILTDNPWIDEVELSICGEVFLDPAPRRNPENRLRAQGADYAHERR